MPAGGRAAAARAAAGESPATAISIFTLTTSAKNLLEGGIPELWVHGEITSMKPQRSGHCRFILKDRLATVECVLWASDALRAGTKPADGLQVVARGKLTIWEKTGRTQFVVKKIEAVGEGAAERLKKEALERLRADGLLAPERKRRLPLLARRVAVITSLDGAAMHDIVSVIRARSKLCDIVVVNARVQGDEAVLTLCDAFERVGRWKKADVVILARGGGAAEELRAFNDERVARAVAACPIPVISAVGHEVDTTICDLVADVRAPTPSAAAEKAVRPLAQLKDMLWRAASVVFGRVVSRIERGRERLQTTSGRLSARSERVVERRRVALERLQARLVARGERAAEKPRSSLERVAGRLDALSPLKTLSRGYALAVDSNGGAMTTVGRFRADESFDLILRDGRVHARTESTEAGEPRSARRPA